MPGHVVTDPNNPDTDGDGMSDYDEALGMYDPLDPGHRLAVTHLERDADMLRLSWIGKGGGTVNTLVGSVNIADTPFTNVLFSAPCAGGEAPWFKLTNTTTVAVTEPFHVITVRTGE